jgi:GTP cyclohydrolase I
VQCTETLISNQQAFGISKVQRTVTYIAQKTINRLKVQRTVTLISNQQAFGISKVQRTVTFFE